jgi:ElaB/YqjD/DUF883 family membrane-anchored ribosome-binding protein
MAENETALPSSDQPESKPAETPVRDPAECPKVRSAAEAVRRAEAELKKARGLYEKVRHEATERLKSVREKSLGDLLDGTLAAVKKHPGLGVIVSTLIGFLLGRWLKK